MRRGFKELQMNETPNPKFKIPSRPVPYKSGPTALGQKNQAPHFIYRPTRVSDLNTCFSILKAPYAGDPEARKKLVGFWSRLVESGSAASGVIEDKALGKRLVGFGIGFFATKAFARECLTAPPFLQLRAVQQWKRGKRPFLTREEIARANTGEGLVLITMNFGMEEGAYGPQNLPKLIVAITRDNFHKVHDGYKIVEMMGEIYGAHFRDASISIGFNLRRDYGEFSGAPALAKLTELDRPYLIGVKAEETDIVKVNQAFSIFNSYTPPRFYFRPKEQSVLEEALEGSTDEEIARHSKVSIWSVKKRWGTIYEKVSKADPEMVKQRPGGRNVESRSKEKRRHLLNYLKDHPEELRPLAVPRRGKSKA